VLTVDALVSLSQSLLEDFGALKLTDLLTHLANSFFLTSRERILANQQHYFELRELLMFGLLQTDIGREKMLVIDDVSSEDKYVAVRDSISQAQLSLISRNIVPASAVIQFSKVRYFVHYLFDRYLICNDLVYV
jgi:hypothetical protein